MRVAVTGASGFIGQYVIDALRPRNADVIAVCHSSGRRPAGVDAVLMDIADPGPDPIGRMGNPDVLIHLAWGGLPNYRSADHVDVQLPIQRRFLRSCVESGLRHVVVSGTCLEYGMRSGELDEAMVPDPTTAYARAKNELRASLEVSQATASFELSWLRIYYLYGSGQAPTSLYAQLSSAVARGDASFDMSPGDQVRDFLAIEDAARIIVDLAMRPSGAGIVNVCSGQPITVLDRVHSWLKEWNAAIDLRLGVYPYPDYEPFSFWGSRRKLASLLSPAA